ncbi:reticulocyte-binding protein homolog 2a-like [Diorhabda sublineata]|uniref:reticulocyte-binding protein homolog 2a-like n=1 Tax=Diorhabda sublineata TaxID=1163346 RepID=UPI0024E10219|nr:reticulocyte-binding protein homolog 2a-like [Diorhabda sublineata]
MAARSQSRTCASGDTWRPPQSIFSLSGKKEEKRRTVEEEVRRKEEEEEERRKFEWELIQRQKKNKKINRSTDRIQSTILEEENEEEGDESSEGALLKKIIFGETGKKREREESKVEGEIENKKERKEGETTTGEEEEIDNKILEIKNMMGGDEKLIKKLEELRELITKKNLRKVRCRECREEEEKQRKKEKTQNIIRELDTGGGEYEVWERLAGEEWEEEVYKKTRWERDRVEEVLRNRISSLIIIGKERGGETIEKIKKLREEVWGIIEELEEGQLDIIENRIKTKNKEREWHDYLVRVGEEEDKKYKIIREMAKLAAERGEKIINVIIGEGIKKNKIRQLLEYVGRREETEWKVITKGEENGGGIKTGGGESLFIKTGDKKFSDVLKNIKNVVNVEKIGVKVESVRKTGGGDLLVKVKGQGAAERLKEEINNRIGAKMDMTVKRKEAIFTVMEVDPSVTPLELKEAVCQWTGIDGEEVEVRGMRESRGGGQTATLAIREERAAALRTAQKIKVHWQYCSVKERFTPLRCYRCLEYGHSTYNCSGKDRSRCCFNCIKEGHRAQECQNEAWCLSCDSKGHRTDTMACPKYRNTVFGR